MFFPVMHLCREVVNRVQAGSTFTGNSGFSAHKIVHPTLLERRGLPSPRLIGETSSATCHAACRGQPASYLCELRTSFRRRRP